MSGPQAELLTSKDSSQEQHCSFSSGLICQHPDHMSVSARMVMNKVDQLWNHVTQSGCVVLCLAAYLLVMAVDTKLGNCDSKANDAKRKHGTVKPTWHAGFRAPFSPSVQSERRRKEEQQNRKSHSNSNHGQRGFEAVNGVGRGASGCQAIAVASDRSIPGSTTGASVGSIARAIARAIIGAGV